MVVGAAYALMPVVTLTPAMVNAIVLATGAASTAVLMAMTAVIKTLGRRT